eukprot:gene16867-23137_t
MSPGPVSSHALPPSSQLRLSMPLRHLEAATRGSSCLNHFSSPGRDAFPPVGKAPLIGDAHGPASRASFGTTLSASPAHSPAHCPQELVTSGYKSWSTSGMQPPSWAIAPVRLKRRPSVPPAWPFPQHADSELVNIWNTGDGATPALPKWKAELQWRQWERRGIKQPLILSFLDLQLAISERSSKPSSSGGQAAWRAVEAALCSWGREGRAQELSNGPNANGGPATALCQRRALQRIRPPVLSRPEEESDTKGPIQLESHNRTLWKYVS